MSVKGLLWLKHSTTQQLSWGKQAPKRHRALFVKWRVGFDETAGDRKMWSEVCRISSSSKQNFCYWKKDTRYWSSYPGCSGFELIKFSETRTFFFSNLYREEKTEKNPVWTVKFSLWRKVKSRAKRAKWSVVGSRVLRRNCTAEPRHVSPSFPWEQLTSGCRIITKREQTTDLSCVERWRKGTDSKNKKRPIDHDGYIRAKQKQVNNKNSSNSSNPYV